MPSDVLNELAGKRVVVWGNGREGQAAVHALASTAVMHLAVIDDTPQDGVLTGAAAAAALGDADVIIKSPGVSKYDPRVMRLAEGGVRVTGGSALWMAAHHRRTVAVTGSKGKSTTSALIHHLLASVGIPNTYGGNIGVPLLDLADDERYVVELSSYQCAELDHSPDIAVLTALFPEHLNWHGSAERYYADKLNLVAHSPGAVVFNATDPRLSRAVRGLRLAAPSVPVDPGGTYGVHVVEGNFALNGHALLPVATSPLRGEHNVTNVCLALSAVRLLTLRQTGTDLHELTQDLTDGLRTFQPLPHRLHVIAEQDGLRFVDDSLSIAPQAAIAALDAFADGPVALLVGGQDRGVDYEPLRDHLRDTGRAVHVIGLPSSGARILALLHGLPAVTSELADDLTDAVRLARAALPSGGTVLLSPAAPSYGIYRDHRERGAAFAAAVEASR